MDFLSEITQEADESGAYQEFLLYYKHKGKTLHLFFEGKDDPSFYSGFINEIIINDLSPHNTYICYSHICGDKYKVYEMYVKITNRFTKSRCLFFVDKDFSDYLEQNYPYDEHIYVTDFYSIENFLVTKNVLIRIWREIYHIHNTEIHNVDKVLHNNGFNSEKVFTLFEQELKKFYLQLISITAWIIYTRKIGLKTNCKNIELKTLFKISNQLLIVKNKGEKKIKYLERACGIKTPQGTWLKILSQARELRKDYLLEPKKYVRGKYDLWFFIKFLDALEKVLLDIFKSSNIPFNVSTRIHEGSAIEILGPRVLCPTSLRNFLLKHRDNLKGQGKRI